MPKLPCSICKKEIKDFKRYLEIGYGFPQPQYRLCQNCGKPLVDLLEKHGLKSFSEIGRVSRGRQQRGVCDEQLAVEISRGPFE